MKTILVVDDNLLNRDLACAMLERCGMVPILADSGKAALDVLSTTPIDVVVTDIGMPEMSGIELCQAIRSAYGDARPRLVAFTSFGMEAERRRIIDAGFDALVIKPATRQTLFEAVLPQPVGSQA